MRINMLGGPGISKSTTSALIFHELKKRRCSVELVGEQVKLWAYEKRTIKDFHQVCLFGQQMDAEYRYLACGVKNIVTDSPLILNTIYSQFYYPAMSFGQHLEAVADEYEAKYPSLNIILNRKDRQYVEEGRFQTLEQAKQIDELVRTKMHTKLQAGQIKNLFEVDFDDTNKILEIVLEHIDN